MPAFSNSALASGPSLAFEEAISKTKLKEERAFLIRQLTRSTSHFSKSVKHSSSLQQNIDQRSILYGTESKRDNMLPSKSLLNKRFVILHRLSNYLQKRT